MATVDGRSCEPNYIAEENIQLAHNSPQNPYVNNITTTVNPATSPASTTSRPEQDAYGNVVNLNVSDYTTDSTSNIRTYYMTYTASNPNYAALYIFNRQTSASVTPLNGNNYILSSTTSDGGCGSGLIATNATRQSRSELRHVGHLLARSSRLAFPRLPNTKRLRQQRPIPLL